MTLRFGSLFSGIGGIDLGLERAGMTCAWQVEVDEFCRGVLGRHWPALRRHADVRDVEWPKMAAVDLVAGGFPCVDLSHAHTNGHRRGLDGPQSSLWREFALALEILRPRWVLVENVETWRSWVPEVRADLAGYGYASLPLQLYAGSFGAPHRRPRCFVVAHADGDGEPLLTIHEEVGKLRPLPVGSGYWRVPPPGGFRLAHGVPSRVDRLRALGNAVVPQVAEWLGRRIAAVDSTSDHRA